ncbi:hypothetical protein [Mangrovimonas xylaniphaga]|uniref:hypothetical protein n=1 Tax=Mangrovimonas xylaniphaga TaxID=1645915 RepID=UPI0006B5351A|nr:hypothetical protein [Mangrovimonas xylaniphaga]
MQVEIKQSKLNFIIDKYDIHINGKLEYVAKSKLLAFYPKIGIYDLKGKQILSVEKMYHDINKLNYVLKRNENSVIEIHTNSLIDFSIRNHLGVLHFCEQRDNLVGIFQNDTQVGLIDKNKKILFGGDEYQIKLNENHVDPIIVIGFIIAYDCQFKNNKDSMISSDLGNLIIEPTKAIDPNWKSDK